jgi:hypothetical protein
MPVCGSPTACMVGRLGVPLIPLFLAGNSTPTIPHKYSQHKRSGFPVGSCDTAEADGRRGSHLYEVSPWLWQFRRGKPRLGGLSVEETPNFSKLLQTSPNFSNFWRILENCQNWPRSISPNANVLSGIMIPCLSERHFLSGVPWFDYCSSSCVSWRGSAAHGR